MLFLLSLLLLLLLCDDSLVYFLQSAKCMSSLCGRLHFIFSILFEQNDEAAMLQGEHEAEKMIVEAYAALLLAFLSTERFVLCISFSSLLYKAFTP